ncbi:MAG: 23S rRNA (pseudouridine(1915)-N(3))-methyltransferase RlmH [Patescibacteria group bacterium]
MLDITLVTIGKIKDKSYLGLSSEYQKRLKPYSRLKVIELEAVSFSEKTKEKAKEFEAERIENFLNKQKDNAAVYLLAERGEIYDSVALANWLNKKSPLILVLGGSLGFSDKLYSSYPGLSLSPLTFPHELARVVMLEQLYRAATILQKKNYHY